MSIVSEIKCNKCDRMYSGTRARCPYCSARRMGGGKHSDEADNARGKLLIAMLIMSVLIVATGVLVFTDEAPSDEVIPIAIDVPEEPEEQVVEISLPPSEPVVPLIDPEPEDDNGPGMPFEIRSLTITYDGSERTEFTAKVDEIVPLRVRIEPVGVEGTPIWTSSDRSVFEVIPTNTEQTAVNVRGIGSGTATLTVSVGDVSQECVVRVR